MIQDCLGFPYTRAYVFSEPSDVQGARAQGKKQAPSFPSAVTQIQSSVILSHSISMRTTKSLQHPPSPTHNFLDVHPDRPRPGTMAGRISTVLSEAHLVNRTLVENLLFEETHGISYCQYILGGPFCKPL